MTNQVVEYNDSHDPYNPFTGSFGISNACCLKVNGSVSPAPITYDNVIIQNTSCPDTPAGNYCLGYGIEAWGYGGTFNSNLIQNNAAGYATIAFGPPEYIWSAGTHYSYNDLAWDSGTYYTSIFNGDNYDHEPPNTTYWATIDFATHGIEAINNTIQTSVPSWTYGILCQDNEPMPDCLSVTTPITYSPNSVSSVSSFTAITSARPGISPASGTYSSPQLVTVNANADNTSSYCTTDGSSPMPDSGSTFLYTGPFWLSFSGVEKVECVGMWGSGANPYTYPSGYGYVPSAHTVNTYTSSGSGTATCTSATGTFGTNCYGSVQTLVTNVMNSNYVTVGSVPVMPSSCTFYLGSTGISGRHIVCGIVKAPTSTTEAPVPDCHAEYTEPSGSTAVNAFITVNLYGCPVEPAGANLWVFENTNDSAATLGYFSCGTTGCGSSYVAQAWNSFSGFPSSFSGESTWHLTNFITVTPSLVTSLDEDPMGNRGPADLNRRRPPSARYARLDQAGREISFLGRESASIPIAASFLTPKTAIELPEMTKHELARSRPLSTFWHSNFSRRPSFFTTM